MKWCRYVISALLCAINCRYLTMKIMEEGSSQTIECPGDCKIIVDDKMVMFISMMFNVHIDTLSYPHSCLSIILTES